MDLIGVFQGPEEVKRSKIQVPVCLNLGSANVMGQSWSMIVSGLQGGRKIFPLFLTIAARP